MSNHEPMTQAALDEIRERQARNMASRIPGRTQGEEAAIAEDIPNLIAEVARLRARYENSEMCYVSEMAEHSRTRIELEAAKHDMWAMRSCLSCGHCPPDYPSLHGACVECDDEDKWVWRGGCPENAPDAREGRRGEVSDTFICRYCGQERPWAERDYEYGLFLAEIASFDALGHTVGATPYLICQTCAEESKREGFEP